jgi:hypothetical protein
VVYSAARRNVSPAEEAMELHFELGRSSLADYTYETASTMDARLEDEDDEIKLEKTINEGMTASFDWLGSIDKV